MTSKPLNNRVYITDTHGEVWGQYGSDIGACRAIANADERDTTWQKVRDTLTATGKVTATINGQPLVFTLATPSDIEDVSGHRRC